jgi:AcrR family transcriptional regulator
MKPIVTGQTRTGVQQQLKELTRQRVVRAVHELAMQVWLDEISLARVAERANVSVQTLFRHFGSREQLLLQALAETGRSLQMPRQPAEDVGIPAIVDNLLAYYELNGLSLLRLNAQAAHFPLLNEWSQAWQEELRGWLRECFDVYLRALSTVSRQELESMLAGLTDVRFWQIYRGDLGKSLAETRQIWIRVLRSVLLSYR